MESLKIKVDVKRRTTENINLQQGYTYPIELTILDNGKEYDCTGATPQIHFAKSNGTFNIKTKDITIEGNKVSFILDSEATNRSGTGKLQAVLTRNGFTFGSWAIFCNIFENVIQDGATEDKNVIDILTELKDEITTAKPLADSLNANIPKAQPLVNSLNTQIPQATEIAREIESIIEEGGAVDKRELGEYKKDFEGVEHNTLNSRLNRDFDNLHQRMNDSSLLAYEGTSIKADNTYLGLTKDTIIKGRTLHNLLDMRKGTYNGAKVNYTNKTITYEINSSTNYVQLTTLKPKTTYTLIYDCVNLPTTGDNNYPVRISDDGTFYNISLFGKNAELGVNINTFTTNDNVDDVKFILYSNDRNLGFKTKFPIILEGDHTETPLEELPFIEGIESVGDKCKNIFGSVWEVGGLHWDSGADHPREQDRIRTGFIPVESDVKYKLSHSVTHIFYFDKNKNFISYGSCGDSFTTLNNCNFVRLLKLSTTELIEKFQIERGEKKTIYTNHFDGYKVVGKSQGKNLVDINEFKDHSQQATEQSYKAYLKDKIITIETTKVGGGEVYTDALSGGLKVYLEKGKTYIISYESDKEAGSGNNYDTVEIYLVKDGEYKYFIPIQQKNKSIKPTESGYFYFRFDVNKGGATSKFWNIQIEESTTQTPYEPYQESNYSYILNEPLRSLPNGVCDTIDLATGVLTRRVGKVVLDGTQKQWTLETASEPVEGVICFDNQRDFGLGKKFNYSDEPGMICDKFPSYSREGLINNKNGIADYNGGFRIRIQTANLETGDVQGFIKWLSGNQVTVYYELNTPTTEQLTPQQLKSFDTTTHIISENKLMPIVSTKIPSDVNAVVQNLKAENVKLEKQLDSAIEELNNKDIDLIATDWETDYRLCELEWTILDTMKVETLTENKVLENRILSRYEQAKILIESGKYNKSTMEKQLTMYYNRNYLTKEEFNELMQLINPIGEVETLEELDKVE